MNAGLRSIPVSMTISSMVEFPNQIRTATQNLLIRFSMRDF